MALLSALLFASTLVPPVTAVGQDPAAPKIRHHVLLVGVSLYPAAPSVQSLPGVKSDILAMHKELAEKQGFLDAEIEELKTPEETTLTNIQKEIKHWLIDPTKAGDAVVLYWSGHGTTVKDAPDLVPGHTDGQEQALLTSSVHFSSKGVPDRAGCLLGSKLGGLLRQIKTTNVTVIVDACCSAGTTRSVMSGDLQEKVIRNPEADDNRPPHKTEEDIQKPEIVALAAAQSREPALEAKDGPSPFTQALIAALEKCRQFDGGRATYHDLYVQIQAAMPPFATQHPAIEGDESRYVFGGLKKWEPYFGVEMKPDGKLKVFAGQVQGVQEGTLIDLYLPGDDIDKVKRRAVATAHSPDLSSCYVQLAPANLPHAKKFNGGKAVVEPLSGPRGAGIRLDVTDVKEPMLLKELGDHTAIRLVRDGGKAFDFRLRSVEGGYELLRANGEVAKTALPATDTHGIVWAVLDGAQWTALAKLPENDASPYRVSLQLVRVNATKAEDDPKGLPRFVSFVAAPPKGSASEDFGPADSYALKVRVDPKGDPYAWNQAYITILDLQPDGSVTQLWPEPWATLKQNRIDVFSKDIWLGYDSSYSPSPVPVHDTAVAHVTPDTGAGREILKVIITRDWVNFQDSLPHKPPTTRGGFDPLAQVISDFSRGMTRGPAEPPPARDGWATDAKTLHVLEPSAKTVKS
jgi:hypothetical protein